jgi:hypothetical protein
MKTSQGVGVADRAELIKWLDALDMLIGEWLGQAVFDRGLQMVRACRHPDALWLAALLPVGGGVVTREAVCEVLQKQGDDPRGLMLRWALEDRVPRAHLRRAAEMGYAPAQAQLSIVSRGKERFKWAQAASQQRDRAGLCQLASLVLDGLDGCARDRTKALELYRESAELSCAPAEQCYAMFAFGETDWQRYYWWGRTGMREGFGNSFCRTVVERLLPRFEKGEMGRALHVVALVLPVVLKVGVADDPISEETARGCERVLELHEAMVGRARLAIDCWSAVGRRCGVAKDLRVMIAKMVWEEAWRWGEKQNVS